MAIANFLTNPSPLNNLNDKNAMQTTQEFAREPLQIVHAINFPFPASSVQDTHDPTEDAFKRPYHFQVYVERLSLDELIQKFPSGSCYATHLCAVTAQKESACAGIPGLNIHRWAEIAIWLPDLDDQALEEFAHQMPDVANYLSADYMSSSTMLVWRAQNGQEVRVDTFAMFQAQALSPNDLGFGVAFVNRTSVRYATHHMSAEALHSFVCSLQVAEASSGWNYKPYRVWDDDFLEAHKGLSDTPMSGIHVPELIDVQRCPKVFPG